MTDPGQKRILVALRCETAAPPGSSRISPRI